MAVISAYAYFDGQNLFHAAREAFGGDSPYNYPSYDPLKLARAICAKQGWTLAKTKFFTGIPRQSDDPVWNQFWEKKFAVMGSRGIVVTKRYLRQRTEEVKLSNGQIDKVQVRREKGIDVRIALDVIDDIVNQRCDAVVIFSQDQDLAEVVEEGKRLAQAQKRSVEFASAFPLGQYSRNKSGLHNTINIPIDKTTYDQCLDPNQYKPKRGIR